MSYQSAYKNIIFPISCRLRRMPIHKYLETVRKNEWLNEEKLEEYQKNQLDLLVKHAIGTVPIYQKYCKLKFPLADFKKIKIVDKEVIRKNFPEGTLSSKFKNKKLLEQCSSGSTGEPFKFFITPEEYAIWWAYIFRAFRWAGYDLGMKMLRVWSNPVTAREHKGAFSNIKSFLQREKLIQTSEIEESELDKICARIKRFGPNLVYGYTSYIHLLAKHIIENDKQIEAVRGVVTTAETLFPEWRKTIEKAFDCKVHNFYGGEGTSMASECEHGNMHIFADNALVEFIIGGKEAGNGKPGEIVLTNLHNYAMPFIRYNIQDIGIPSKRKCKCGRELPLVESIEGRTGDIIITPAKKFLTVAYFIHLFEFTKGVMQFQIVQNRVDRLHIKIIPNEHFDKSEENLIKKEIVRVGGPSLSVEIELVDEIKNTQSGKRKFVISKIPIKKRLV